MSNKLDIKGKKGEEKMNINEAVKKALEEKCGLTRKDIKGAVVIPIHEKNPFDVYVNGKRASNWNPTPDDLMAGDWEIIRV